MFGFESYGSIGRRLVDGAEKINLFGEEKIVTAKIHTLNGFSAHAGQTELLKWFSYLAPVKPKVVVTHGEDLQRKALAGMIKKQFNITCMLPKIGDFIEL